MNKMNIVIPMAGRGSRFADVGFTVPKPLIPIHGIPMYRWALKSLPLESAAQLTFVVLRDHWIGFDLKAELHQQYPGMPIEIVSLEGVTRGQSETVLRAKDVMSPKLPLLIYNCDSYFESSINWSDTIRTPSIAGLLVCFSNSDPRYSYARADAEGNVDLVREKEVISSFACTGAYYFGSTQRFMELAAESISGEQTTKGEFYVAPLYNRLIADGEGVKALLCDRFGCFGTPEELRDFENAFSAKDYSRNPLEIT